ncbi:MAG: tetratricopeptide repeat protein [Deltaproteobacteria bacterium]|nr:tetratricopeptide repeat protein [Deltaproteobacteria bacterium]
MKTLGARGAIVFLMGAVAVSCGGSTSQVKETGPVVTKQKAPAEEEEDLTERKVVVPKKIEFVEGIDKEAQKAFKRGVIAVSATPPDYVAARTEFEKAIALDKAFLEAYFNLGMTYERTEQPEKAIEVYERAIRANPGNLDAEAYIGKVYLSLSHRAKQSGNADKARKLENDAKKIFDEIIIKDPDNVTANNALALYWLFRGKRDMAEDFVKKVLMMKPRNVVALNTRGLINLMAGKLRIARWVFEEKALKEDPNSTEAWTNLGLTYFKMGKTPEAVTSFEKAIELNRDNVPARMNVAAIYLDYLHYEAALKEYNAVLKLVPNNVEALIGSGSSLLGMHKPKEAVERWEKAIKLAPNRAVLYARTGKVYETLLNEMDKAIAAYEKYVALANPPANDPIKAKLPVLKQIQAQGGMMAPEPEPEPEAEDGAAEAAGETDEGKTEQGKTTPAVQEKTEPQPAVEPGTSGDKKDQTKTDQTQQDKKHEDKAQPAKKEGTAAGKAAPAPAPEKEEKTTPKG